MQDAYGRDVAEVQASREWAHSLTDAELGAAIAGYEGQLNTVALIGADAMRYEAAHIEARARATR